MATQMQKENSFELIGKRSIVTSYFTIRPNTRMRVYLRFDDSCGNGHNTFSITAETRYKGKEDSFGCLHDDIKEFFPEFAHLIKWHLCSVDGPIHYIANTMYWMNEDNLENARESAIAPSATENQLSNEKWLRNRLPELLQNFRIAMDGINWYEPNSGKEIK